jgi:hypothetical protein
MERHQKGRCGMKAVHIFSPGILLLGLIICFILIGAGRAGELVSDFNGDGIVNFSDFSILAQYWLLDESLVDIAPAPVGDQIIDYEDLLLLTEYWLETEPVYIQWLGHSSIKIWAGDGGYDFFGRLGLSIGFPNGGHGSMNNIEVVDPNSSIFKTPYSIEIPADRVLQLYTETNHVGIFLWPTIPDSVTVFGSLVNDVGYYLLVMENNRYFLWGFSESPDEMTETGKKLFINTVIWMANAGWDNEN